MAVPLRPGVAQRRGFLRLTPGLRLPAGITRGAILGSVEIVLLPRHQAAAAQPSPWLQSRRVDVHLSAYGPLPHPYM
jgi:hypothetical protein